MRKRSKSYVQGAVSSVSMRRNKFDLSHGVKTSMNMGTLYPIDVQEVLPGDTFVMKSTHVVRLTSAYLRPVMDNCWYDEYSFFVPLRLLYDDSENVFGIAEPSEYEQSERGEFPTLPKSTVAPGSIADYMGLPVTRKNEVLPAGINLLPFRAFALIYNEWFRNENVQQSVYIQKGEFVESEVLNDKPWSQNNYTGMPPKITKKKDYFTACLPSPQKGEPVSFSLADKADLVMPMAYGYNGTDRRILPVISDGKFNDTNVYVRGNGISQGVVGFGRNENGSSFDTLRYVAQSPVPTFGSNVKVQFGVPLDSADEKAYVDLSNVTALNVNDLRFAFQLQKMYEKDARYGTRYREYILGHFGVTNADARMQVPEFLGGRRTPLGVTTVAQTSAQQGTGSPLASLGGMSHSVGNMRYTKSFTEHGYVITVAAIRQMHTYQQGIEKMWFRKERNDYYDPLFANLGEQPVYAAQLKGTWSIASEPPALGEGDIFGYNEYGAEYRYRPSYITGQMRTGVENSLDIYHFGDYYANAPTLSPLFINETSEYFDRTIAVSSDELDSFVVDIWVDLKAVRVMPLYSTPGLIDHH